MLFCIGRVFNQRIVLRSPNGVIFNSGLKKSNYKFVEIYALEDLLGFFIFESNTLFYIYSFGMKPLC